MAANWKEKQILSIRGWKTCLVLVSLRIPLNDAKRGFSI